MGYLVTGSILAFIFAQSIIILQMPYISSSGLRIFAFSFFCPLNKFILLFVLKFEPKQQKPKAKEVVLNLHTLEEHSSQM